jgi:hypothetical protein
MKQFVREVLFSGGPSDVVRIDTVPDAAVMRRIKSRCGWWSVGMRANETVNGSSTH